MPLYEYKCKSCGHLFEVIQKFSDKPIKKCPKCGKTVERLVSSSAIQFKGTGWYVTDYAKRSSPVDSKSESKHEKDGKESAKDAPAGDSTSSEKSSKPKESKESKPAAPSK